MADRAGEAFALQPRSERPQGRFDLLVGLGVALTAAAAYVVALSVRTVPDQTVASAMLTAAPLLCLVGLSVYRGVSRDAGLPALRWASAGLFVCFTALTLQYVSFPSVASGGGPLGTDAQSSAALYLLFHLALFVAAGAGAIGVSIRWSRWFQWAGCLLAVAIAANLVPLPLLIEDDVVFTPALTVGQVALVAGGVACTVLWVVRAGRSAAPLMGWFGVTLALSVAEVALNAATSQRFEPEWWASLSMRVATFAVLAGGSIGYLLSDRRRLARYAETELVRRETQLTRTADVARRLMDNAAGLSRAVTPDDVANVLADTAVDLCACERVLVVEIQPGRARQVLASRGYDPDSLAMAARLIQDPSSPAGWIVAGNPSTFAAGHDEIVKTFPALEQVPVQRRVGRLAAAGLQAAGALRGALIVSGDDPSPWDGDARAIVSALAAQGGPALARARVHAQEHDNAETLQRALLPASLPHVPGLELAHRYLPADTGAWVGGDWYDVQELAGPRWLFTVGDVVGKGIEAAATMGTIRHSIRGLAMLEPDPAALLTCLDTMVVGTTAAMATLLLAAWDPSSSTFTYARAGHVPPLLLRADGSAEYLYAAGSLPIGVQPRDRLSAQLKVHPGDTFLLYTDGLVEHRGLPLDTTLAHMRQAAKALAAQGVSPHALADGLTTDLTTGRPVTDDIAMLVIHVKR